MSMIETASLNEILLRLAGFDAGPTSGWLAFPRAGGPGRGAVDDA
jgi:hypothetical protein